MTQSQAAGFALAGEGFLPVQWETASQHGPDD
jgi:hypothetical protein